MSERSECRFTAIDLLREAKSHNYEGGWAQVAVAASNLEIAAALWELKDFLDWAFERSKFRVDGK